MFILVAVPKSGHQREPIRIAESTNLSELMASKCKLEEAHGKYTREATELKQTEPMSFEQYEGTEEEYKSYCEKLREQVWKYGKTLNLQQPPHINHDLYII